VRVPPDATADASPLGLTVATAVADELHVNVPAVVVLLSELVMVGVNCCVWPLAIVVLSGDRDIETGTAAVTVRVTGLEVALPRAAVI
jgi:hypothetical protein